MNNFEFKAEIVPTDDYENAKLDLCKALDSIGKLTPVQRERLINEVFGAVNVAIVCNILKQIQGS